MTRAYVGIDVGTQGARVMIASGAGEVLGAGRSPLESTRKGNRHEQDPWSWWTAVCEAATAATLDLPEVELRAVAVCATSGSVVLAGRDGKPRGPGLMYDDGRAGAETELLNRVGVELWQRFGYARMQPAWALPRVLWLRRHADWDENSRVLHQADFVNQLLVGDEVATDVSTALKSGCDVAAERWPTTLFEELGIGSALPELVRPGQPLGAVCAAAARTTGLPEGLPVLAGMTDGCAAQLASGAVEPGTWNSVLGTTLALKGVTARPIADPDGVVYSHRGQDDTWLPGGASGSGAGAIPALLGPVDHDAMVAAIESRPASDLLVYPLATERGERFPFVAPPAQRFVLGKPRDRADLYAAVLQGIALVERLCFDHLDLLGADCSGAVHLTGSAATNTWLAQLRADVLGRPTVIPRATEPAFGMAVLAAAGDVGIAVATAEMVAVEKVLAPRQLPEWVRSRHADLVAELERRGWLAAATADHARARLPQ